MVGIGHIKHELHEAEQHMLNELRALRRTRRQTETAGAVAADSLTVGQKVADTVASTMGSWRFIIIQSCILLFWIAANITAYVQN
ncbi:MAG TPA: hypothetical protein VII56_10780 [Rhizomicrobium sp.]